MGSQLGNPDIHDVCMKVSSGNNCFSPQGQYLADWLNSWKLGMSSILYLHDEEEEIQDEKQDEE